MEPCHRKPPLDLLPEHMLSLKPKDSEDFLCKNCHKHMMRD